MRKKAYEEELKQKQARLNELNTLLQLREPLADLYEKAIRKYYLTRQELSFQAMNKKMFADSYSVCIRDDSGKEH